MALQMKTTDYNFLDEVKEFSIHEDDYARLPKSVKKVLDDYETIRFYPKGKVKDKVKEFKKVLKQYTKEIQKNDGEESNIECIMIDQMLQLMQKMFAHEIRSLKLEKLLK
jgi:hypothetical protein